jgi:Cof subfamily protein (haloacid dehalogenase superfamily)
MISLDVDGTLLDSKGSLPPGNEAAVKRAISMGVKVILNTGKPLHSIEWLIHALNLKDPVALLSGAFIVSENEGKNWNILQTYPISEESLTTLADLLALTQLTAFVCTDWRTQVYHAKNDPAFQDHMNTMMSRTNMVDVQILDHSPFEQMQDGDHRVLKIFLHGDRDEEVQEQLDAIRALGLGDITTDLSSPGTIDVYSSDTGKRQAIEYLCKIFEIERSEVLALGDYDTDVELIQWAGVGALMKNAPAPLKAQVSHIAPSNDDQGVAHMIHTHVFKERGSSKNN